MHIQPLRMASLFDALAEGWQIAQQTLIASLSYAAIFVLGGALVFALLLTRGWTPFLLPAAGAFMLIGPVVLAGFFGIAQAHDTQRPLGMAAVVAGFAGASRALWALSLVCGLLFMIFITDAAILYAYMLGDRPIGLGEMGAAMAGVSRFGLWAAVSGGIVAFLLYAVSAFAVPLLCECRAGLVQAVVISVRVVFGNFPVAMVWGGLLAALMIGSILLLPLLFWTLPWLAYASRALYRQALPSAA